MVRRRYHLQWAGVAYFALTVLLGVAAAYRPNNLLVWGFATMLAGVIVSGILSGGMLVSLRVTRLDPRHGRVGEPMVLRYAISNGSRFWPLFDLQVGEGRVSQRQGWQSSGALAPAWLMHTGPGEEAHAEAIFKPSARGRFRFTDVQASSSFPFGILRKTVLFSQPMDVLVFPKLLPLRGGTLDAIIPHGLGGVRSSTKPGPGEDFLGVREYRPGDSLRQIAWKRRAGLEELATIERSTPAPPRLRVVLDLTRPTDLLRVSDGAARSARDLEEDSVSLAASLLTAAEREGYEFALDVEGFDTPRTPLRRGHWHLQKLMAVLAGLDLDATRTTPQRPDRDERAGVVIVHPDRIDMSVDRPGAFHLSATRLEDVIAAPLAVGTEVSA